MTTKPAFPWTDAYALGYQPMDDTHREFVETVNAMLTCPDDGFQSALDAFATHAERHFEEEKAWMDKTEFPAKECHIDEHNAVLKSVREVQQMFAAGATPRSLEIGRGLAAELVRWFPGHADYLDSALAQWMGKRAYGGVPVVFRRNPLPADQ
ncbi:MAG: hemerythrin [Rhodocyclaceae bacterium]|nr:MAG: hemerythrin [Rhodocyclaceae bacterium]